MTAGQSITVRLLNYRKSGEPFLNQVSFARRLDRGMESEDVMWLWSQIHLAPLRDQQGNLMRILGVQGRLEEEPGDGLQLRRHRAGCSLDGHLLEAYPRPCPECGEGPRPPPPPLAALAVGHVVELLHTGGGGVR